MLTRSQKEELVKDLTGKIASSKVAILSDFTGTTVSGMKQLRDELRKKGATYKVTKKKLIDLAFKNAGIEANSLDLEGQIGLAIGQEDEVSAAKILSQFSKKNKNFKILRGVLEKKVISDKEVMALAALPSREELLVKLVGAINAPISGFLNVLTGNLRNFMRALKAIAENK